MLFMFIWKEFDAFTASVRKTKAARFYSFKITYMPTIYDWIYIVETPSLEVESYGDKQLAQEAARKLAPIEEQIVQGWESIIILSSNQDLRRNFDVNRLSARFQNMIIRALLN